MFLADKNEDTEVLTKEHSKYGETAQMTSLIDNYHENANTRIGGSIIMVIPLLV